MSNQSMPFSGIHGQVLPMLRNAMIGGAKRILHRLGLEVHRTRNHSELLADQPKSINDTIAFVRPYTMTSAERIAALCQAVVHVEHWQVPGDIVECGVWKGGSMMAAAITLRKYSTNRSLYLYDTFGGMPPPSHLDKEASSGRTAQELLDSTKKDARLWAISSLEEVKFNMERVGYPSQCIHYVKGKVEDTIPANMPNAVALLRLDTDWYESTKHELTHLWPLLSPNGILIIDDYGFWTGARKAVDEFFRAIPAFMHRIDDTGRLIVKPPA
jgi:O-methyltransferase